MENNQSVVALLLGVVGAAIITAAVAHAFTHGIRTWKVLFGAPLGAAVFVAGVFWSRVSPGLDGDFVNSASRVASNFWVWLITLWAFLFYLAGASILSLIQRNKYAEVIERDIIPFRLALQRWVIPRHLTQEQIASIGNYLLKFPPYSVRFNVQENDEEASSYRADLQQAIEQGGGARRGQAMTQMSGKV
jgi:hypothetical protein